MQKVVSTVTSHDEIYQICSVSLHQLVKETISALDIELDRRLLQVSELEEKYEQMTLESRAQEYIRQFPKSCQTGSVFS